ncbi:MAG: NAD(P)H-hydrate dehydratase [Candidatus Izemoplasmatales bacterium]|nr:NAD(P)H-hydrate dehydratase [Candidatus Izemoplasmatales bacterium]
MVKVFYAEEIRKIEELTCKEKQINIIDLMYQVGYVLTKDFLSRVMPDVNAKILVIANIGNNGGDAIVVFQELKKLGYNVFLSVVGNESKATEAFKYYYDKIEKKDEIIAFIDIEKEITSSKHIIDGIFGIGLKKEISGKFKDLIFLINNAQKNVYAIDLPSGINPDSGEVMGIALKAKYTGVIGNYKLGNFLNDALDYHGEIKLLDLGLLEGYSDIYYLDYNDIDISRLRTHNSSKYDYGKIAFIGSSKMPGAINLAAIAAHKSGIGLADVFYEEEIFRYNIEIIYDRLNEHLDYSKYDVCVFGPGIIDKSDFYQKIMDDLIESKIKLVVDAGGLKYLDYSKKYDNLIITPHLGELSQILNLDKSEIRKDSIKHLRRLAQNGMICLLKGATSIIQEKRYTYLMQAKNTGLATAGTGDVLSGIIGAFLVDETLFNAAVKGTIVHMIAADYARVKRGEVSMVATDIVDSLYKVWTRKR